MTLETERLVLRPVAAGDLARLQAIFTQPGVRRVIFDDKVLAPEDTLDIIQKSDELFATARHGLWLAERKSPRPLPDADKDAIVGFGALWHFRDPPELELLYGVADGQLKRGYGREIASAVVQYGFDALHLEEIRASTDPAHADSRRLLDALGFTFERQAIVGGLDTVFYCRRRD